MYARVVRWNEAKPEAMRESAAQIGAAPAPPEGVPASGIMLLTDPDGGQAMAITLFETEEDRQKGHETLNAMNPPGDGMGNRTGVEMYEVAVDLRL